jgi:hypothetical protein
MITWHQSKQHHKTKIILIAYNIETKNPTQKKMYNIENGSKTTNIYDPKQN